MDPYYARCLSFMPVIYTLSRFNKCRALSSDLLQVDVRSALNV